MKNILILLLCISVFTSNSALASKPEKIALEHKDSEIQTVKTFSIIDAEKTRASAEVKYQVTGETDFRKLKLVQFDDGWKVQFEEFPLRWCIPE